MAFDSGGEMTGVVLGARHLVQMVFTLVTLTVETLVVTSREVVPPVVWVLVTGQLVTVL